MYPGRLILDSMHAAERSRDLIAEAARERTIIQAQAARRVVPTFGDAVRWTVGVQVIRAGQRIRGAHATTG